MSRTSLRIQNSQIGSVNVEVNAPTTTVWKVSRPRKNELNFDANLAAGSQRNKSVLADAKSQEKEEMFQQVTKQRAVKAMRKMKQKVAPTKVGKRSTAVNGQNAGDFKTEYTKATANASTFAKIV